MLGLTDALTLEITDTPTARQRTDAAATALHHSIEGQQDRLREDYADALGSLVDLPALRQQADAAAAAPGLGNRETAHAVFAGYTRIVSTLFASHDRFSLEVVDPEIRQGDDLVHYGSHATDAVAQLVERMIYVGTGPGGVDRPAEAAEIASLRRDVDRNNSARCRCEGVGPYAAAAEELAANPRVGALPGAVDRVVVRGAVRRSPGAPGRHAPRARGRLPVVPRRRRRRARRPCGRAEGRRRGPAPPLRRRRAGLVVLALVIAWLVSRSITRPLRDLSVKARAMADLPAPGGGAGHPRRAVRRRPRRPRGRPDPGAGERRGGRRGAARSTTCRTRRSASPSSRPPCAATSPSRTSTSAGATRTCSAACSTSSASSSATSATPKRLAKLYKLDHLATRLRRNAESLLVLSESQGAGDVAVARPRLRRRAGCARRGRELRAGARAHPRPGPGARRRLGRPRPPAGRAHRERPAALAAPRAGRGRRASAGPTGTPITIVDHGLGMTPDEIERANQRLAGAESVTVTPARYLGHYVTAVLAARHGIGCSLRGSIVVGIAAVVELPAGLLVDRPARGAARRAPPLAPVPPPPPPPPRPSPGGAPTCSFIPDVADAPSRSSTSVRRPRRCGRRWPSSRARPCHDTPAPARGTPVGADRSRPRSRRPGRRPMAGTTEAPSRPAAPPTRGRRPARRPRSDPPGGSTDRSRRRPRVDRPTRTASGLVRRVRGANVPVGAAAVTCRAPVASGSRWSCRMRHHRHP